jgi:uncharacterized protein YegJ (DUF2314 family)
LESLGKHGQFGKNHHKICQHHWLDSISNVPYPFRTICGNTPEQNVQTEIYL